TSRCFALRLKAPPLDFGPGGPASGHTLALNSLSLAPGALHDKIAARLLNDNATGASLIDQELVNGTTETVYLTVSVTKPNQVTAMQSFAVRNYTSTTAVSIDCYDDDTGDYNPDCNQVGGFPSGGGYTSSDSQPANTLTFPVKLYELDGLGAPTTEIPCLA